MPIRPRLLVVAALVSITATGLACGRSEEPEPTAVPSAGALVEATTPSATPPPSPTSTPPPTPTPTPIPPDPDAVLSQAGKVMAGLSSFHFRLEHEEGNTEITTGLFIDDAEGNVVNPDKIAISFTGTFGRGFAIRSQLVTLGETSYMTNPLNGKWEAVPVEVSPLGFFSPTRGIAAMTAQVENPRLIPDSRRPPRVLRLAGDLPAAALSSLLGRTLPGVLVKVELTIDAELYHLVQARVVGRVTTSDTEDVVRVITLSSFDEPFSIEPPSTQ